jgi:hypothetical protein
MMKICLPFADCVMLEGCRFSDLIMYIILKLSVIYDTLHDVTVRKRTLWMKYSGEDFLLGLGLVCTLFLFQSIFRRYFTFNALHLLISFVKLPVFYVSYKGWSIQRCRRSERKDLGFLSLSNLENMRTMFFEIYLFIH